MGPGQLKWWREELGLAVSESRVCQVLKCAIHALRATLSESEQLFAG
jgi:hypothetical protein